MSARPADPDLRRRLLADGWEERFSASGLRLEEAVLYYRSLGFEVRVEELFEAAADGTCTQCFAVDGADGPTGIVFTRGEAAPPPDKDGLFEE